MPGTYSQILLHIVYSTKGRKPWISSTLAEDFYPFIGGIVRDEKRDSARHRGNRGSRASVHPLAGRSFDFGSDAEYQIKVIGLDPST